MFSRACRQLVTRKLRGSWRLSDHLDMSRWSGDVANKSARKLRGNCSQWNLSLTKPANRPTWVRMIALLGLTLAGSKAVTRTSFFANDIALCAESFLLLLAVKTLLRGGGNLSSLPMPEFVCVLLCFVTGVADTAWLWSASNKTFQTPRYSWTPVRVTSWKWPTSASTCPSRRRKTRRSFSRIRTKIKRASSRDTVPSKHWHAPAATATPRSQASWRPSVWSQDLFQ